MAEKYLIGNPDPKTVASVSARFRRDEISMTIQTLMPRLKAFKQRSYLGDGELPFCRYSNWTAGGVTVEVGLFVDDGVTGAGDVKLGKVLESKHVSTLHNGHFNELATTHSEIENWILENGYEPSGIVYEFFLVSPEDEPDPSEWKVKVVWELK